MKRILSTAEILIIVIIALVPIFATLPYRINIFLSWEGAYRLYLGQTPFKDFGMPVGYMYWEIPAMFFKIFGPQMITLVKAQAFINILSGLAFRSIFKSLGIQPGIRFASVLVFCLSYTFFNYWPWYNNTVIMYELVGLAFLMKYIFSTSTSKGKYGWLVASGFFIFCSFFTKQDGGALGLLICLALLGYLALAHKQWLALGVFVGSVFVTGLALILPVTGTFGYWFNHGQPPHSSRMSIGEILGDFLGASQMIKFYILLIVLLLMVAVKNWKEFWLNKQQMIFTLLTLGILAEATIFQVTSYVPVDNNIFFHSFAFAFIIYLFSQLLPIRFDSWKPVIVLAAVVMLWWSQVYWRYIDRFVLKSGGEAYTTMTHEGLVYANVVNRNTFMIHQDSTDIPLDQWRVPKLKSFERIMMPNPTVDGIERLMNMDLVKNGKNLKVLNMSELTPLAAEVPFALETGPEYPLWFHKGVGMFDKETDMFVNRIQNKHYDLVLFEYIPYLNNFYPFKVREALQANYKKVDVFTAPRKPSSTAWVEVYVKP
ncbi:hypothetical protein [Paraflavitalea sp. CAU 1676]|uniref:hypothetical protein n=1 Tax=Paraflavitalea sp. CAU 1676 TaxID=3032598 RepID=UPI0023DAA397|nr:hypothetical protein [Paraflavitalea sp. CAU 1676]MDF2187618.1 hypothetical protein [Paraflavitalea sp. CAU 1676]